MRSRRLGFTLIEVLAAVAVVGLVFSLLARVNIEALRAEGIAEQRLEAALVADRALTAIESGPVGGSAPPFGRSESSADRFRITLDVTPLQFELPAAAGPDVPDAFADAEGPTLLDPSAPEAPLRRVVVTVAWDSYGGEERIERETYVFDTASAGAVLETVAAQDEQKAEGAAGTP